MDQITLKKFRCFRERQTARLAPLTLLLGENSTGKTSFLALIRALISPAGSSFRTSRKLRMISAVLTKSLTTEVEEVVVRISFMLRLVMFTGVVEQAMPAIALRLRSERKELCRFR